MLRQAEHFDPSFHSRRQRSATIRTPHGERNKDSVNPRGAKATRRARPLYAPIIRADSREEPMVKITDTTDYSRFARPTAEDEGMWLDHVEVHLVTHPVGKVKEMHVHDPPQDHVIVIRSGRMRWTVEDQTLDAGPGDVIVTPAGVAHGYEVLGDELARVVCVDSPTRPRPG
jgi:quercetin dioxygenase-like cupin family protein